MRIYIANAYVFTSALLLPWVGGQLMAADAVYKCVKNGKISYSSNPSAKDGQCQQTAIRDDGPKPEELARILETKRLRQEEERKANEIAQKERDVRAKELEAAAADRRAKAIEEELLLLKQTPQSPSPVVGGYPYYYPYYGVPMPGPIHPYPPPYHQRPYPPSYEVPGQPVHPLPQPLPAQQNRIVPIQIR